MESIPRSIKDHSNEEVRYVYSSSGYFNLGEDTEEETKLNMNREEAQ